MIGWVKVLDQSFLAHPDLRIEGPTFQFFENVSLGLTTYTYWGQVKCLRQTLPTRIRNDADTLVELNRYAVGGAAFQAVSDSIER